MTIFSSLAIEFTRTLVVQKKIPQQTFIEWLSNDEIKTSITYPSNFWISYRAASLPVPNENYSEQIQLSIQHQMALGAIQLPPLMEQRTTLHCHLTNVI
jgi:hypothetical protein